MGIRPGISEHRFAERDFALLFGLDRRTHLPNGADSAEAVSLFGLTGVQFWVKMVFLVTIAATALNGLCGLIILKFDHPVWDRHRLITGMVLSIVGVAVFIAARQPYAGIIYFALLVIKTLGIWRK